MNARIAAAWSLAGAVAVLALHLASQADATFAAADGFSGRIGGQTCVACHAPPSPLQDDAHAMLDGLPEAYEPGASYELTIRVEGGPSPMPAPAPQGGFDLAVGAGTLAVPAGSEALLRQAAPDEMTYTPEGTLRREWHVTWIAPTLATQPAPADVWLAVLAANGNHVVALGASDQGETLDSGDHLHRVVPPSAAASEAWRARPLSAPEARLVDGRVEGAHTDANATALGYRIDGGKSTVRATSGASWSLALPAASTFTPGDHVVEVWSEGAQRTSPPTRLTLVADRAGVQEAPSTSAPAAALPVVALALLVLAFPHSPRRT